jgi:CheY-like chemotaxis protein
LISARRPILLVEDDANDVALFQRAVHQAGIRTTVLEAADADEAMRILLAAESGSPGKSGDLPRFLLLDVKMPRKSGLELLAWLRSRPVLRRIPVIILTSSREPADIRRAYELGANSYLVKPVSFDQLKELVQILNRYWSDWNEESDPV